MNGDDGLKTNNNGFTLVELIVVIAVMGIIVGLAGLSVSSVTSAKAKRSSESINMLISKCRLGCLSREGIISLEISIDGDGNVVGNYYENNSIESTATIPAHGVSITYTMKLGNKETPVALEGHPLTLSFDRGTGAQTLQSDGSSCTAIVFDGGSINTIELSPLTGNHKLV